MNKSPHARIHSLGQPKWAADFTKSSGSVTLGRHPNATIVLDDQQISMKHVTLEQSVDEQGGRRVTLVESSTNGTIVGHTALAKGDRLVLHHGDEITLPCQEEARRKDYTFRFEVLVQDDLDADQLHLGTLQEQCDALALQAARVGASVYANSDKVAQLAKEALEHAEKDPLEDLAVEMLAALQAAAKRLSELGDAEGARQIPIQVLEKRLKGLGVQR